MSTPDPNCALSDAIFALSKITGFKVKKVREELGEYED